MPHSQAFSHRVVVTTALIGLGLALRLPGLALNGIADVFQMILDWGFDVVGLGHAEGFDINYGILSYAVFGWAADLSEAMPRFWWAPYKGFVIVAEAIVLAALMALVPRSRRRAVLCLYWLNPWFILHGAYQGFWEGGYLLCGLLAVLGVGRIRDRRQAWAVVGVLLMASGMFKPQGLVYFVGPVGLFLGVEYLRGRREPLVAYLVGVTGLLVTTALSIWTAGGSVVAIPRNYAFSFSTMANLSNGGPNIWRTLSYIGMRATGQVGEVYDFRPGRLWVAGLSLLAGVVSLAVLAWWARKATVDDARMGQGSVWVVPSFVRRWLGPPVATLTPAVALYLVLVVGALVMSQFGVRAHVNHTYGATVLLIPVIVASWRLAGYWWVMVASQAFVHLAQYGLGGVGLLPPDSALRNYPYATVLIERIKALPAYTSPDWLLQTHEAINAVCGRLADPALLAMLSLVMFGCTVRVLRTLARRLDLGYENLLRTSQTRSTDSSASSG